MSRGRRSSRTPLLFAVALVILAGGVGAGAPAVAADDSGTLSVTITDDATPAPTPSPSTGGAGTGAPTSPGGSVPAGGVRPAPIPVSGSGGSSTGGGGTAPATEVSVAGMLYVGGLNAATTPALDPAGGVVDVWFTVRNAASTPMDLSADFWMDAGVFPQRLDAVDDVAVSALQPGETRVVSAHLQHGGQWTLLSTHVTLTPPESVDGVALTPVTRDALTVMFPWVVVLLLVLGGLAVAAVQVVRVVARRAPVTAVAA